MNDLVKKGCAEKVSREEDGSDEEEGKVWYILHHTVYNPQKPDKVHVVFDCRTKYNSHSLNKHLLQGPDMTMVWWESYADSGKRKLHFPAT